MIAHIPRMPVSIDPLIAEAKQRARRRRQSAGLALLGVAAVATMLTLGLRPGGLSGHGTSGASSVGVNASPTEVAAIKRAVRTDPSTSAVGTLWFTEVRISTVDPRYAYVRLDVTAVCPACSQPAVIRAQDAVSIVQRNATGWHVTSFGRRPPRCGLPRGVRKEFFDTTGCPAKP